MVPPLQPPLLLQVWPVQTRLMMFAEVRVMDGYVLSLSMMYWVMVLSIDWLQQPDITVVAVQPLPTQFVQLCIRRPKLGME